MTSKHLSFELIPNNRKTQTYGVRSKYDGYFLGEVKWNGRWRQYCLYPNADCVWSKDCLEDIVSLIKELMDERRKVRKNGFSKVFDEQKASRNPESFWCEGCGFKCQATECDCTCHEVSLCKNCNSMTHTIKGKCGKCEKKKVR